MRLELLPYAQRASTRRSGADQEIWCRVRRAWLLATPEEFVRQGLIEYLDFLDYPTQLMQAERRVGATRDRLDLLVLDRGAQPFLLAEAKAPGYNLQPAVEQLATYNRHWRAPYVLAVNGERGVCCALDYAANELTRLGRLPPYPG